MTLKIFAPLIIVWGSFAAPASAQPSSHPLLTAAEWTFFAAAQADAGTTYRCQASHSCIEVDPLYAHLSPSASVAASLAIDAADVWLIGHVVGKHHPRIATAILFGLTAVRVRATIHTLNLPPVCRSICALPPAGIVDIVSVERPAQPPVIFLLVLH